MAKSIGFIGTIHGKSGNLVFRKGENGATIMSAYQPSVKNPRTSAQMLQRAKMNVAGQFSSLVPASLIAPLGLGSALRNRSEFTRNIINNSNASLTDGSYTAKFSPHVVKFSRGQEQLLTVADTPQVGENRITVILDVTNVPSDMLNKYGERVVIGIMDNSTNAAFDAIRYIDHIVTNNTTSESVTFNLHTPLTLGQSVVVWRLPFVISPEGLAAHSEDIHLGDDEAITAIMATSASTLVSRWGDTQLIDVVPFTPGS